MKLLLMPVLLAGKLAKGLAALLALIAVVFLWVGVAAFADHD